MKVILFPLFQGVTVRNLLRNDFLPNLLSDPNLHIVFLIKSVEKKVYLSKEFSGPKISYEVVPAYKTPSLNELFTFLKFNLLNTKRMDIRRRVLLKTDRNYIAYALRFAFNRIFSRKLFRRIVRFLDMSLVKDDNYLEIFDEWKPDLVITAHAFGDDEASLLRQAKKRGVKTLAIINSWDKLTSRGILRILPDVMSVPNDLVKSEAIRHADMDEVSVVVTGMPYFDMFYNKKPRDKEWFYSKFGIPLEKRIILICPTGQSFSDLDAELINRVARLTRDRKVNFDTQIIVRFPPNDTVDTLSIQDKENIIFYQPGVRFSSERGVDWDMNDEDNQLLIDMLAYSNVVICPPSSITIDASILDRPIVNVKFGTKGYSNQNIDLYYESDHYKNIMGLDGFKLVQGDDELALAINSYLNDPSIDREGRNRIVKLQYEYKDGKSAGRLAKLIDEVLNK